MLDSSQAYIFTKVKLGLEVANSDSSTLAARGSSCMRTTVVHIMSVGFAERLSLEKAKCSKVRNDSACRVSQLYIRLMLSRTVEEIPDAGPS